MWDFARKLELLDRVADRSKLTERDALKIGEAVKRGMAERYAKAEGKSA